MCTNDLIWAYATDTQAWVGGVLTWMGMCMQDGQSELCAIS